MKLGIALVLCLASNLAIADCYVRSNIKLTRQTINAGPTDVQRLVTPIPKGQRCLMQYRVHIGDEWKTAEGTGEGATEGAACAQALDIGNGSVLAEIEPSQITAKTQMICSDLPDIRVRPVRIGEIVWESETDMHLHPEERKYFTYKSTRCRMFTERGAKDRNLSVYQGIICKMESGPNAKWRVVDKY